MATQTAIVNHHCRSYHNLRNGTDDFVPQVHESVVEEFLELVKAHASHVKASGNVEDKSASLRGLFTEASATRVEGIVADAISKGAKVVVGSAHVKGNVVQPLLLSGVTSAMRTF